jgi:hypothetical protein
MRSSIMPLGTAAIVLFSVSASAATITDKVMFNASHFAPAQSPTDPVTGTFTITFDPTLKPRSLWGVAALHWVNGTGPLGTLGGSQRANWGP